MKRLAFFGNCPDYFANRKDILVYPWMPGVKYLEITAERIGSVQGLLLSDPPLKDIFFAEKLRQITGISYSVYFSDSFAEGKWGVFGEKIQPYIVRDLSSWESPIEGDHPHLGGGFVLLSDRFARCDFLNHQAEQAFSKNKWEDALRFWDIALYFNPQSWQSLGGLGEMAFRTQSYGEAKLFFEKAINENPEATKLMIRLGYVLLALGQEDEAREWALLAIKEDAKEAQRLLHSCSNRTVQGF
jgi:tetratricopeptide (TPR) repeat protein